MRNKTIFALLLIWILLPFGGCQLAVADDSDSRSQDKLCGVFITLDYVDTTLSSTELPADWNGDPSRISFAEQPIYAEKHEDPNGTADYTFNGISGFRFFTVTTGEGGSDCLRSVIDDEIQEGNLSVSDDTIDLSGTIYFDVHASCCVYANPVYQTPDGRIYMESGEGMSFGTLQTADSGGSTALSETKTETVDGKLKSRTINIKINVQAMNTNKHIVLKQMDASDRVVAKTDITQGGIPESIRICADTAYLILEENSVDFEGNAAVKRTLLNPGEDTVNVHFTGDRGIVQAYAISLEHDPAFKDNP